MKKINLLIAIIIGGAFLPSNVLATLQDTKEDLVSDIEVLRQKVYNATAENAKLEQEVERAKLLEQLRIENEKAAVLAAEKKRLEEDASLPKKWEDIPYMEVKVTIWRQFYSQIENTFDPRKSSNSLIKETSKALAQHKKFKPAVSQINSSYTHVLQLHPNQWKSSGVNEDTETHLNIARFLLDKIWIQSYQGKVGFTL